MTFLAQSWRFSGDIGDGDHRRILEDKFEGDPGENLWDSGRIPITFRPRSSSKTLHTDSIDLTDYHIVESTNQLTSSVMAPQHLTGANNENHQHIEMQKKKKSLIGLTDQRGTGVRQPTDQKRRGAKFSPRS